SRTGTYPLRRDALPTAERTLVSIPGGLVFSRPPSSGLGHGSGGCTVCGAAGAAGVQARPRFRQRLHRSHFRNSRPVLYRRLEIQLARRALRRLWAHGAGPGDGGPLLRLAVPPLRARAPSIPPPAHSAVCLLTPLWRRVV